MVAFQHELEKGKPHVSHHFLQRFLHRLFPPCPLPENRRVTKTFWKSPMVSLFFSGSYNVVRTSISRQLEIEDIDRIQSSEKSDIKSANLGKLFKHYQDQNSKHPLLRALARCYGQQIFYTALFRAYTDCARISSMLIFYLLIIYLTNRNAGSDDWRFSFGAGVGLFAASAAIIMSISVAEAHSTCGMSIVGSNIKTALDSLIYQKSFVISPLARRKLDLSQTDDGGEREGSWSEGSVISIMNTDTERICNAATMLHGLWPPMVMLPLAIGISYYLLGWTGVAGLATTFIFYPFIWMGGETVSKLRRSSNIIMDARNGLISDTLKSIRLLKSFVWEDFFYDKISDLRRDECKQNYKVAACQNIVLILTIMSSNLPTLIGTLLFSIYGNDVDGALVIPYYGINRVLTEFGFSFAPACNEAINAHLSIKRIEEYLLAEENPDQRVKNPQSENAISFVNVQCLWDRPLMNEILLDEKKQKEFTLSPISFNVKPGELVAIIGPSGSGKSSLVSAITGGIYHESGSISLKSSIAYCPQRPWIRKASVRDNILFGLPLDQAFYDDILHHCALVRDINQLPNGDLSEIGELGTNLSGGQKQRIQLARTLYMNRDIIIMDDPLSAVDVHTSKHLFENVICGHRFRDKCRVLVTHQLQVLDRFDRILFMQDGRIVAFDTYQHLLQNGLFQNFLRDCKQDQEDEEEELKRQEGIEKSKMYVGDGAKKEETEERDEFFHVHDYEERALSSVSWRTYHNFIKMAGSYLIFIPLVLTCCIAHTFNIAKGLSYAWWSDNTWGLSNTANFGMVAGIIFGQWCFWLFFITFVMIFCIRGSRETSSVALRSVMNASVPFFNQNPMGRIINRFTVDINQMDVELPMVMWDFFQVGIGMVATVVTTIVYVHLVGAIVLPWCFVVICMTYIYKSTPREIKRLEALANSNVSSHLSEGYSGRESIRCSDQKDQVLEQLHSAMDDLNSLRSTFFKTVQWIALRQDAIACIFYFIIGILVICLRSKIAPSVGAIIMLYSFDTFSDLRQFIETITKLQKTMISVERLQYYCDMIKPEGVRRIDGFNADKKWPQEGHIVLQNVDMRYRESLPLSLENINLDIPGGAKVGVVGRTGAGKSSLFQVLLRIVGISTGKVYVDGVDIHTQAGLQDVREHIAVIPQDPTLFEGTVRSNLDPLGRKDDHILNAALQDASLVTTGVASDFNLDKQLSPRGENLSHGQRQLMALARALVKDTKIIISDEATSSIDYETDAKVQQVMMNLKNKTVISIAHRIRTIIHCDYICVMSDGRVVDFDTPLNLFDQNGDFRSMCDESKLSREDLIVT